jgi:hypothetical protein
MSNIGNCIFDSVSALKVIYCPFVIQKLAEDISLTITLHILYDSLVHRLLEGHHIWRKVQNRNISQPQFKFTTMCVAIIKEQYAFAVFTHANLVEMFFH